MPLSFLPDMQSSGALPVPKSSAAVATSLKKSVSQGKPDLHPRPAKIPEITNTTPTSPVTKSAPSLPKPVSKAKVHYLWCSGFTGRITVMNSLSNVYLM